MAATASPPSEAALARFLAEASGADRVEMAGLELLAGGAIQENWGFGAELVGGRLAGTHRLVLRTDAATGVPSSLGRVEEFAILRAAHAAGVAVPEPLFACANPDVIGKPFFVMRRLPGNALGRAITIDPALEPALPRIAARLGAELARIQTIRPPRADLGFLPSSEESEPETQIAGFRAYLGRHPRSRPVLEWAIRWLETHIPARLPPVLCHRDFRTGNYMLDGVELTGILDWEFAGWGDPDEDIGWFCCKGWRFARLDREAGGIADRAPFYQGYESASGRRLDPERVRFWEIFANVRWAVIALQQSDRYLTGGARDLSTAIIGRRAAECELELLMLLDHAGPPASCRQAGSRRSGASPDADSASAACARGETPAVRDLMRDLPSGFDLVELGRDLLLDELLPLVPEPRRRELHLVATAIAIARREALAGDEPIREILGWLTEFYGCLPEDALLCRFAADLRNGAFATSQPREQAARAILWRMTIARLREGNPQFLAANGFA